MTSDEVERDPRGAIDPRDEYDAMWPGDPHDPRTSGNPRDDVDGSAKIIMPRREHHGVPQFVKVIGTLAITGILVLAGIAWQISDNRKSEEQRVCERTVTFRDDTRAMWLFALNLSEPQTPAEEKRVKIFTAELDKRLPELYCVNGIPTEKRSENSGT